MSLIEEYKNTFGLPKTHSLELISEKVRRKKGDDNEKFVFAEYNESHEKIATYTVISNQQIYPPHKSYSKITKTTADGDVIVLEETERVFP